MLRLLSKIVNKTAKAAREWVKNKEAYKIVKLKHELNHVEEVSILLEMPHDLRLV